MLPSFDVRCAARSNTERIAFRYTILENAA